MVNYRQLKKQIEEAQVSKVEPPQAPKMTDKKFYSTFLEVSERLKKTFINRTPLLSVGHKAFTVSDVVAAGVLSNTNMYFIGSRGSAKTVLAETVWRSIFNEDGFYLRGDMNLQLKDLLVRLNFDGKTEDEIYQISRSARYLFALVDELNRVPGLLQNQLLNIADGYIEIRGKKYPLGINDYMLMIATGNPVSNGEYTGVFDEDLALLDRIALILNMDEIELAKGDVYTISERNLEKSSILKGDMSQDVLACYRHLAGGMGSDDIVVAARSLLSEMFHRAFRYVDVSGKQLDKAVERSWRDKFAGSHDSALVVSYCSDISVRTLKSAGRLASALFKAVETESGLLVKAGLSDASTGMREFVDAYIESMKLALNYDRRFIPDGLPEQLDMTHREMLAKAFDDVNRTIDIDNLETAVSFLAKFSDALSGGDERAAADAMKVASEFIEKNDDKKTNNAMRSALDVMESMIKEREEKKRNGMLKSLAEEED